MISKLSYLALPAVVAASLVLGVATATAGSSSFNEKFEFDGVTLGDVTSNGTIYAGSKQNGPDHNLSQFTNCSYFDADGTYLGQFGSDAFASPVASDVENFCLDHFADRTQ